MEILTGLPGSEVAKQIANIYRSQVLTGRLPPPQIVGIPNPEYSGISAAFNGVNLLGIASFKILKGQRNLREFSEQFKYYINDQILDRDGRRIESDRMADGPIMGVDKYGFTKPLLYLEGLESIEKRKGIGGSLLRNIQGMGEIGAVVAYTIKDSIGFYERFGFVRTGFAVCDPKNPIIFWSRDQNRT